MQTIHRMSPHGNKQNKGIADLSYDGLQNGDGLDLVSDHDPAGKNHTRLVVALGRGKRREACPLSRRVINCDGRGIAQQSDGPDSGGGGTWCWGAVGRSGRLASAAAVVTPTSHQPCSLPEYTLGHALPPPCTPSHTRRKFPRRCRPLPPSPCSVWMPTTET